VTGLSRDRAPDPLRAAPAPVHAADGLTASITPKNQGDTKQVKASDQMYAFVSEIKAKNPGMSGQDAFEAARSARPELFK